MEHLKTNTNRYVLPTPTHLRGLLNDFNRLYAYPVVPELPSNENAFIILDSGAFGLSQQKREMNLNYMASLSKHYETYKSKNVFCVAPDVFLNPIKTVGNLKKWVQNDFFADVNVVFQFQQKKRIDIESVRYMLDEYEAIPHSKDIAFFSNPGLGGADAQSFYCEIQAICELIRSYGYQWIHVLGAGWSVDCITKWATFVGNAIDSLDSIAYYTAKPNWRYDNVCLNLNPKINNAFIAQKIIIDYAIL